MRGIILQFDGLQGVGIVSSNGVQYPFTLKAWSNDTPPESGQRVEIILSGTEVVRVTRIEAAQIVQEKIIQYWGTARQIGQATYRNAGQWVTVAYGFFALLSLFADTIRNIPIALPGLVNGFSWGNLLYPDRLNGGFGFLLVLLAILSILIPVFWNDSRASLVYALPALITLIGLYHLLSAISDVSSFAGSFDTYLGHSIRDHAMQSITLWFWLMLFDAGFLAWVGVQRYRHSKPHPSL